MLAVFLLTAKANRFWHSMSARSADLHHITLVGVFVAFVVLAVRWVWAADSEMALWVDWLNNPPLKPKSYLAIASLSITLALCLAFSLNSAVASFLFSLFLLLNYWAQWLFNAHFRLAVETTKREVLDPKHTHVLAAMEQYWFQRPQLARITAMMFFSMVAFSLALAGGLKQLAEQNQLQYHIRGTVDQLFALNQSGSALQIAACWVLIADILLAEAVITYWRRQLIKNMGSDSTSSKRSTQRTADETYVGRFDTAKWAAYWGILVVFDTVYPLNGFKCLFESSTWDPIRVLGIVLLALLAALAFLWIFHTGNELELWLDWLKNPMTKEGVYVALFGLAFVLGTLIAFSYAIVRISALFSIYLFINYWAQWRANEHFSRALQRTPPGSVPRVKAPTHHEVLDAMKHYWLEQPQLGRISVTLWFACLAFSLALAGYVVPAIKHPLQISAYIVLILDILISEAIIFIWRRERDQKIANALKVDEK